MKKLTVFGIACSIVLLSCTSTETNTIEGTWELVRVETAAGMDSVRFTDQGREIKTIGSSHFFTVWQDTNNTDEFWQGGFNGGTYTYEDGVYSETQEFFSLPDNIGNVGYWIVDFEGDQFSMTGATEDGEVNDAGNTEYWRRIE